MTPRARRLVAAALLLVLLLFAGRWVAEFTATRWWAATISPAAEATVTRWQLLGLALDAGAVLAASVWFAIQALLVTRAIGTVQLQRRVGDDLVRQVVPTRWLVVGALATGTLLGLFTGAGARAWRAPLLLALHRPHYGIEDPLLGVDLGVLVASYPLWRAAHGFALTLVVLGITLAAALYLAVGAFTRPAGRLELHPDARRHLGALFCLLGLVIAAGYLLTPYRLATSVDVPLEEGAASIRVLAAHAAAGAALAAAALSIGWLLRARHSLLLGGWLVLGIAAIGERLVVPAFVAEAGSAIQRAGLERLFDSVFHHITLVNGTARSDTLPPVMALWDEAAVTTWAAVREQTVLGLAPIGSGDNAAWLVATSPASAPGDIHLARIAATGVDRSGRPVQVDSAHAAVAQARSIPGATGWQRAEGAVAVGRLLRPVAIAWARQAPGVLKLGSGASIDWARDPRERVSELVPVLEWWPIGMVHVDGRLVWLLSGLATVSRAPLATRVAMGERTVSGVSPSLIAMVTAETGAVAFFPDPSADALGKAWAEAFGGIVSPLAEFPAVLRETLPYPREWFDRQLEALSRPHWGFGVIARDVSEVPTRPAAVWAPGPGALQQAMDDPERRRTLHVLTARRDHGIAGIAVDRVAPDLIPAGSILTEAWQRMPTLVQLRDSVRAAGDTMLPGPLRWYHSPTGMMAWQPLTNSGRSAPLSLLWVGGASSQHLGGARQPSAVWGSVTGPSPTGTAPGEAPPPARLEAVRTWMRRADSALARGDLTAFARAWEALRGLLLDSIPE